MRLARWMFLLAAPAFLCLSAKSLLFGSRRQGTSRLKGPRIFDQATELEAHLSRLIREVIAYHDEVFALQNEAHRQLFVTQGYDPVVQGDLENRQAAYLAEIQVVGAKIRQLKQELQRIRPSAPGDASSNQ